MNTEIIKRIKRKLIFKIFLIKMDAKYLDKKPLEGFPSVTWLYYLILLYLI